MHAATGCISQFSMCWTHLAPSAGSSASAPTPLQCQMLCANTIIPPSSSTSTLPVQKQQNLPQPPARQTKKRGTDGAHTLALILCKTFELVPPPDTTTPGQNLRSNPRSNLVKVWSMRNPTCGNCASQPSLSPMRPIKTTEAVPTVSRPRAFPVLRE